MSDKLKIGQEVLIHGYIDEIRKDTIIIRNDGGYFGTVECEVTDIEVPNTNEVLDKIRAEIKRQEKWLMDAGYNAYNVDIAFNSIKSVINKYKAESEEV